eukprot:9492779-Pyramimonas_sp.AAC.1
MHHTKPARDQNGYNDRASARRRMGGTISTTAMMMMTTASMTMGELHGHAADDDDDDDCDDAMGVGTTRTDRRAERARWRIAYQLRGPTHAMPSLGSAGCHILATDRAQRVRGEFRGDCSVSPAVNRATKQ